MAEKATTGSGALDAAGPRQGPAVVLVHGSVVSRKMWSWQVQGLADPFRVVAPDLPGHGDLAHLPFTFDAAGETLAATIDREAGGRAVVIGLSLGGYVAMDLAHRHPERVAALVLCSCSRNLEGVAGVYLRAVSALMRRKWLAPNPDRIERKTMRLFPPALASVAEEQRLAGLQTAPLANAFAAMAGRDWSSLLAEFPRPVLILNGERDSMARKHEDRFAASAPHGRVRTIAGAGHACNLDQREAFDRTVRDFLRTLEPPWSSATAATLP